MKKNSTILFAVLLLLESSLAHGHHHHHDHSHEHHHEHEKLNGVLQIKLSNLFSQYNFTIHQQVTSKLRRDLHWDSALINTLINCVHLLLAPQDNQSLVSRELTLESTQAQSC